MTTKYLMGTYSAGYNLSSVYSQLDVFPGASISGFGLVSGHDALIVNHGVIVAQPQRHTNDPGVLLQAGGTVMNGYAYAKGVISGTEGVAINGSSPGTVINYGSITGTALFGVVLSAGGLVANNYSKYNDNHVSFISGVASGVVISGGVGTVTNSSAIFGGSGDGVALAAGGSVVDEWTTNLTTFIRAATGVYIGGGVGTVTNTGEIQGVSGDGVDLAAGGSVVNQATMNSPAYIFGSKVAVDIGGSVGTVTNSSKIMSYNGVGVSLAAGGYVSSSGKILGETDGVDIAGTTGTVHNSGQIYGKLGNGIVLWEGGSVVNHATVGPAAYISGYYSGVNILGGVGTVVNYGKIYGKISDGVVLQGGGDVSNSGTIEGVTGLYISGPSATVTNNGTIMASDFGVELGGPGTLTNNAAAMIKGATGLYARAGTNAAVVNFGTIWGSGLADFGVELGGPGTVTNNAGAIIKGATGLYARAGTSAAVVNFGTILGSGITGYGGYGVDLAGSGTVTNAAGAIIEAYTALKMGAGVATNLSIIDGFGSYSGAGVLLAGSSDGRFVNGSKSHVHVTVEGYKGVVVGETGASVVNFGTIIGLSGFGQAFTITSASYAATLIAEAGCAFRGKVSGNLASTLDLGAGSGTITYLGGFNETVSGFMTPTTFYGFGGLTLLAGAQFTLAGAGAIGAGGRLIVDGTLTAGSSLTNAGLVETLGSGLITLAGPVTNTGTIRADGGTLTLAGAVTGAGHLMISAGTLFLDSPINKHVTFNKAGGTLELANSQTYTASINGFSTTGGTFLDLKDIGFVSPSEASFSGSSTSGILTVTDGTHTAQIHLTGNYLASSFVCASDGNNGVLIDDPAAAAALPRPAAFAAAMAGLASPAPSHGLAVAEPWLRPPTALFAAPHAQLA